MLFCRGKIRSGKTRSGTRSECSRKSVRTPSFATKDLRPEAIGDGGGARKSTVFSGMDSDEFAIRNGRELSKVCHMNSYGSLSLYLTE